MPPLVIFGIYIELKLTQKEKEKEKKILKLKEERKLKEMDELIQNDFRYKEIKQQLDDDLLTKQEATLRALEKNMSYKFYFNSVTTLITEQNLSLGDAQINAFFLHNEDARKATQDFFKAVYPVMSQDYWDNDSFSYESKKEVNSDLLNELFRIQHERIYFSERVKQFVLKENKPNTYPEDIKGYLKQDFVQQVLALKDKTLTKEQVIYWLMDDLYWESKFKHWKTLGINVYYYQDNLKTDKFFTFQMARQEAALLIKNESNID